MKGSAPGTFSQVRRWKGRACPGKKGQLVTLAGGARGEGEGSRRTDGSEAWGDAQSFRGGGHCIAGLSTAGLDSKNPLHRLHQPRGRPLCPAGLGGGALRSRSAQPQPTLRLPAASWKLRRRAVARRPTRTSANQGAGATQRRVVTGQPRPGAFQSFNAAALVSGNSGSAAGRRRDAQRLLRQRVSRRECRASDSPLVVGFC